MEFFSPTNLASQQVLNWVRDQTEKEPDLQQYVPHLQNNTILRLLQQVRFNLCDSCFCLITDTQQE